MAWLGEHSNRESDDAEIVYKEKRAEILRLRDQIISGEITDFDKFLIDYDKRREELKVFEEQKKKEKEAKAETSKEEDDEDMQEDPKGVNHLVGSKGVSDFWSHIILTHESLEEFIEEKDREILKNLTSMFVEQSFIKPSHVTVRMGFKANDFFTNEMLTYTLRFEDGVDEEQIEAVIGTAIDWKHKKMNVTRKRLRKTQKHRDTGKIREVFAYKQIPSFFNIFDSQDAVACTNPQCESHKGQFEQQKVEFANMSKYR